MCVRCVCDVLVCICVVLVCYVCLMQYASVCDVYVMWCVFNLFCFAVVWIDHINQMPATLLNDGLGRVPSL